MTWKLWPAPKQPEVPRMSKWIPMSDPVDVAHMGKLLEELGEGTNATARALIQGLDERDPKSGKTNRQWMQGEFADIRAMIELAEERFSSAT